MFRSGKAKRLLLLSTVFNLAFGIMLITQHMSRELYLGVVALMLLSNLGIYILISREQRV